MSRRGRRFRACAASAIVVVSACSSGGGSAGDSLVPDGVVERLDGYCGGPPSADLGEGSLCVDDGFRLNDDDFTFANWGRSASAEGNVTVQTLVDLFGRDSVCSGTGESTCVPRPAALQLLEEWNNALSGGRCEGLATMAARFHLGLDDPADFDESASVAADLDGGDLAVQSATVYWWATQFVREVADRAAASRARPPLELVEQLVQGLANDGGFTLALYEGASGHSVTPFAVTRRGNDFVVHVYDNNRPGERREVLVDRRTGSWRYPRAMIAGDGSWTDWSGGTGTFELVPMSARRGPFTCPSCDGSATSDAPLVVALSSRDPHAPGRLRISGPRGSVDVAGDSINVGIEGARVSVAKGAGSSSMEVVLPAGAGDVDVSVLPGREGTTPGDVVVSVRRNGDPAILVSGDLARDDGPPLVSVAAESATVTAPRDAGARVSIASGLGLARTDLDPGGILVVAGATDGSVRLSASDAGGRDLGATTLAPVRGDTTVVTRVDIGAAGLAASSAPLEPVTIVVTVDDGPSFVQGNAPTVEVTAPD